MISCPSMMCVSYTDLEGEVRALEETRMDTFHYDITDRSFVPDTFMGLVDVGTVRALVKEMVDVHLMVNHPADRVGWFLDAGMGLIYAHPESEPQAVKTLMYIRSRGKLPGLTVNSDTSLSTVRKLFLHCDYLLVISVFPGLAGQTFIDSMDTKIHELIAYRKIYGCRITLDGACSLAAIQEYHALSTDGSVLGISALFHGGGDYVENMNLLCSL